MSDSQLRELERAYHQNPGDDTQERWHVALKRAGLCNGETPDHIHPVITDFQAAVSSTTIFFRVYGLKAEAGNLDTLSTTPKCPICRNSPFGVKVMFANHPHSAPDCVATIQGASGGASKLVDGSVVGLEPDGQTEYSVIWDAAYDGLTAGMAHNLTLNIEYT